MSKRLGGINSWKKYKTSSWHLNGFPDGNNIECYYHRGTRLNAMKRFCIFFSYWSHLNVLTFFPPDWGMLRRSRCIQILVSPRRYTVDPIWVDSITSGRNPPSSYCTLTLIAMQGHRQKKGRQNNTSSNNKDKSNTIIETSTAEDHDDENLHNPSTRPRYSPGSRRRAV